MLACFVICVLFASLARSSDIAAQIVVIAPESFMLLTLPNLCPLIRRLWATGPGTAARYLGHVIEVIRSNETWLLLILHATTETTSLLSFSLCDLQLYVNSLYAFTLQPILSTTWINYPSFSLKTHKPYLIRPHQWLKTLSFVIFYCLIFFIKTKSENNSLPPLQPTDPQTIMQPLTVAIPE